MNSTTQLSGTLRSDLDDHSISLPNITSGGLQNGKHRGSPTVTKDVLNLVDPKGDKYLDYDSPRHKISRRPLNDNRSLS